MTFAGAVASSTGAETEMLDAYLSLDAFPDARATLQALKARGLRTAILSNGSPAMLAAAVKAAKLESSSMPYSPSTPSKCSSRVRKFIAWQPSA